MQDFFKSLRQNSLIHKARSWIAQITAPISIFVNKLLAPVRALFAPLTDAWSRLLSPVHARWASFKGRYPIPGAVLGTAGWLIKWGFYLLLFLVIGVRVGLFGRLPSGEELRNVENASSTEIYTADSVLIGKYYIENRTEITLDRISPFVMSALIATEDKRFMEHRGIDLQSWMRVAYGMLIGRESLGGGSTLSQQLAKNLYPRKKYLVPGISLIINKIRENFISIRLERIYTKEELLNLYLNTVPFGGDVFGISVASRMYFNKKARDLSPDQAATLIGMLKGSTLYNPVRNPENAKKRRNVVLLTMLRNSDIDQKTYDELIVKPVGAKRYNVDSNIGGLGTYFREYLRTDVMPKLLRKHPKEDGTNYNLYTDGLKIYTTLHSKMQQYAEEAVEKQMQDLQKLFDKHWKNYKQEKPWGDDKWIDEQIRRSSRYETLKDAGMSKEDILANFEKPVPMTVFGWKKGGTDVDTTLSPIDSVRYYFCLLNCGFMAMDHRNGYVRAWIGGTNFKHFKFDHVKSTRQVGSTFKPIVYAAALHDSISPCTYYRNRIKMIKDWEPHNSDESYGGWYTMSGALQRSVNVVAAQIIEQVGIQKTIDMATQMGVTTTLPREFGISLGAADISLFDMIKVYGTIANKGVRPEPVTVLSVINRDGKVLYDYKNELKTNPNLGPHVKALNEYQASIMTEMLQNVIDHGTGRRLRSGFGIQGDFAGKTGTTQNQADGWFICYNPQLVTGSWVGAESPAVRFRSMSLGQGSAMALPIVAMFWHKVANDRKLGGMLREKFPDPKPEVLNAMSCYNWIGIQPDSFNQALMEQDSTLRDSMISLYISKVIKSPEETAVEGEPAIDAEKEEKKEERKEKRKEFFQKIFTNPNDEKEKNKQ